MICDCVAVALTLLTAGRAVASVYSFGDWNLTVDDVRGCWTTVEYRGERLFVDKTGVASVDLKDDGTSSEWRLVECRESHDRDALTLILANGRWQVEDCVRFIGSRLERRFVLTNVSGEDLKMRSFTAYNRMPATGTYYFPGTFFGDTAWRTQNRLEPMTYCRENRCGDIARLRNSGNDRVKVAFFAPRPGRTLMCFADSRVDNQTFNFDLADGGLRLGFRYSTTGWGLKGVRQEVGTTYLVVGERAPEEMLRTDYVQLMREVGFVNATRPDWLLDSAIYEINLETFNREKIADFSRAPLRRMRQLGYNLAYFLPVQSGTSRYAPIRYDLIEPKCGDWDDYRRVVRDFHAAGMRVMQDMIPHGGMQMSAWLRGDNVSEMLITEDGNILTGWPFDFNNPTWRGKMEKYAEFLGGTGLDAFRVDAPQGGYCPNWRKRGFPSKLPKQQAFEGDCKPIGNMNPKLWERSLAEHGGEMPALEYARGNQTLNCGGLNMVASIRRGFRRVNADSALLLETDVHPFTASGDFVYDRDFDSVPNKLAALSPADFVEGLSLWLEEQQYVDAPGCVRMRDFETYLSDIGTKRLVTGIGAQRALRALAYLVHGVPMTSETCDYGLGEFMRRLNAVRAAHPALRRGTADYRSVTADRPGVFAFTRRLTDETLVPVINFTPDAVRTRLSLAGSPEVALEPFGVQVLGERDGRWTGVFPCEETIAPTLSESAPLCVVRELSGYAKKVIEIPGAVRWQADCWDGQMDDLSDPEAPRREHSPFFGGISRRFAQRTYDCLWDLSEHLPDPRRPELRVFTSTGGVTVALSPDARGRLLNRFDGRNGLFLVLEAGDATVHPVAATKPSLDAAPWRNGKVAIACRGWTYEAETPQYRLTLDRRNGMVRRLVRKADGKVLLANGNVVAVGELAKGVSIASAGHDPESKLDVAKTADGFRLVFNGQLRTPVRYAREPVEVCVQYALGGGAELPVRFTLRPMRGCADAQVEWRCEGRAPVRFFAEKAVVEPLAAYSTTFDLVVGPGSSGLVRDFAHDVPLATDGGFETRAGVSDVASGRHIALPMPRWRDGIRWHEINSSAVCIAGGVGDSACLELEWPNPELHQYLAPRTLAPGRYAFSFKAKAMLDDRPAIRAWSATLLSTQRPALQRVTPVKATVQWYDRQGQRNQAYREFDLPKMCDWTDCTLEFELDETGMAPLVKLVGEPEYAGRIAIDELSLRPLPKPGGNLPATHLETALLK